MDLTFLVNNDDVSILIDVLLVGWTAQHLEAVFVVICLLAVFFSYLVASFIVWFSVNELVAVLVID